MTNSKHTISYRRGLLLALACSTMWGLFPLYWKMLSNVPAESVVAHRVVWSCALLILLIAFTRNSDFIHYIKQPLVFARLALAGAFIATNWGIYIYAVETERVVEASLGYYINPLVNVLLGVLVLKEKLNTARKTAVALSFIGISYVTIDYGKFPWIALALACSFGMYALLKKQAKLDSMPSLTVETLAITPLALIYLWRNSENGTIFPSSIELSILLILGGVVTTLPLFLFGQAAQALSLSTLGFIQYIGPTLQLIIGMVIFHEPFTSSHLVCFLFVWAGLGIYSHNMMRKIHNK